MAAHSLVTADDAAARSARHTRLSAALFRIRVTSRQLERGATDFFSGLRRCERSDDPSFSIIACESRTKLRSDHRAAELFYQEGKVQNLRTAVESLDCSLVMAGQVFSFWKQIGRASARRGYVAGRMLQQGCMIPAIGGGLCQLSNALYDMALRAGCEILERHAHSRVVAGSAAAAGRDATVAWNYLDLRFRSRHPMLIRARVTDDELAITFWVRPGTSVAPVFDSERHSTVKSGNSQRADEASTCTTCAQADCFRRESQQHNEEA